MLLHITTMPAWQAARIAGDYRSESLSTEGFIHTSTPQQVAGVANARFVGRGDLILLCIDAEKVRAPIRYEPADGDLYPHIYGPLNIDAVTQVVEWMPAPDGTFRLPSSLGHGADGIG